LPLVVFVAELSVVTISTVRIIFVARGMKVLAAVLGFFEITIWLFAIGQIMQNLSDIGCYLGFAGGFTLGNFLGVLIENRLAIGTLIVHAITRQDATGLVEHLRHAGCCATRMDGHGGSGPVKVVFTIIPRKDLATVTAIIRAFDADAFYSVEEIQQTKPGVLRSRRGQLGTLLPSLLTIRRVTNVMTVPTAGNREASQAARRRNISITESPDHRGEHFAA
jgi:uncharacterized protein YebE (UPF0316 family)